eukprot:gb/GECH01008322.1/.p1 GENE.gb/GECH01008322.1/~~gb/GECH01008322.1/.p1  ORF type:complete len:220 (+),score=50.90 gb/GECH01008322.1/:1-660(+)
MSRNSTNISSRRLKFQKLTDRSSRKECKTVFCFKDGNTTFEPPSSTGYTVLPGSFNPLHEGHIQLLEAAHKLFPTKPPLFELTAVNADKPPLEINDIEKRVSQFYNRYDVVVTATPRFAEKAELLPNSVFVLGMDTALRLVMPKYYGGSEDAMIEALQKLRNEYNCSFAVGGRLIDGGFHELDPSTMPAPVRSLFTPIPESSFRMDISSTELRNQGKQL